MGVSPTTPIVSNVPLLLIQGDADKVVPFARLHRLTQQIRAPGWILRLRGADHLAPIEGPSRWTTTFDSVTRDFLQGELSDVAPAEQLQADSSTDAGASVLTALS